MVGNDVLSATSARGFKQGSSEVKNWRRFPARQVGGAEFQIERGQELQLQVGYQKSYRMVQIFPGHRITQLVPGVQGAGAVIRAREVLVPNPGRLEESLDLASNVSIRAVYGERLLQKINLAGQLHEGRTLTATVLKREGEPADKAWARVQSCHESVAPGLMPSLAFQILPELLEARPADPFKQLRVRRRAVREPVAHRPFPDDLAGGRGHHAGRLPAVHALQDLEQKRTDHRWRPDVEETCIRQA